jgi:hypothetical protein
MLGQVFFGLREDQLEAYIRLSTAEQKGTTVAV